MIRQLYCFIFSTTALVCSVLPTSAATVFYSGKLFSEFGPPVVGGEIFVGTFAPGFDPFDYNCVYGDEACNQIGKGDLGAFDAAVLDGNFFPLVPGADTGIDGSFFGMGTINAPAGTQIWMFGFEDQTRNSFFQVLTTSSSWLVPSQPSGVIQIVASQANDPSLFVMGFPHPEGIQLNVIPFPEPNAVVMIGLAMVLLPGINRRSLGP